MAERLARGAQAQFEALDEEIARASDIRRFERIAAIDKNILRLAVYELMQTGYALLRRHRRGGGAGQAVRRGGLAPFRERRARRDQGPGPGGGGGRSALARGPRRREEGEELPDMSDEGGAGRRPPWRSPKKAPTGWSARERCTCTGVDPYPNRYERTHGLLEIDAAHQGRTLEELEAMDVLVRIAGRVMTPRGHGKVSIPHLSDGEANLLFYVRQDEVRGGVAACSQLVDRGDYLGVAGAVCARSKGELTLQSAS